MKNDSQCCSSFFLIWHDADVENEEKTWTASFMIGWKRLDLCDAFLFSVSLLLVPLYFICMTRRLFKLLFKSSSELTLFHRWSFHTHHHWISIAEIHLRENDEVLKMMNLNFGSTYIDQEHNRWLIFVLFFNYRVKILITMWWSYVMCWLLLHVRFHWSAV